MSATGWYVGVVVPACNEEDAIAACLQAVREAIQGSDRIAGAWIVVACDSCTDRTQPLAIEALRGCGETIVCNVVSAGSARRLGVEAILSHFGAVPRERIWLANTDADTCVAPDWLERQLCHADEGCAGVAGVVSVDTVAGCTSNQLRALFAHYEIFADGTHPHVHGANLGVRADAYLDAGGWSDKALAEDHCLWGRLKQAQWRVIASASTVVTTSGRLVGRAQGGFADSLRSRLGLLYG